MSRKRILILLSILLPFVLTGCDKNSDPVCSIVYSDKFGENTVDNVEDQVLFFYSRIDGFDYEGMYLDPDFTTEATYDDCKDGVTIYFKQSPIVYDLEIVTLTETTGEVEQIFGEYTAYAYTTTDDRIFIRYYFDTHSLFRFLDVTDYLHLDEGETIVQVSQNSIITAFLTSNQRAMYINNHQISKESAQFTNLNFVYPLSFDDTTILNIEQDDYYLYVLTETHQIYRIPTYPYVQEPYNIMADLYQDLEDNYIVNMYFTEEGNDHIVVVDNMDNVYTLHEEQDTYSLRLENNTENIPTDLFISMFEKGINYIPYQNDVYLYNSINLSTRRQPNGMINETETSLKKVEFYPVYFI